MILDDAVKSSGCLGLISALKFVQKHKHSLTRKSSTSRKNVHNVENRPLIKLEAVVMPQDILKRNK